jgi:hypothetical protein
LSFLQNSALYPQNVHTHHTYMIMQSVLHCVICVLSSDGPPIKWQEMSSGIK